MCIRCIDDMQCCTNKMNKNGKTRSGVQRFVCKNCGKTKQKSYTYRAYSKATNDQIVLFLKEGMGIRSISRVLKISSTTVLKRIISLSRSIRKPSILIGQSYEVDEMYTYLGNKENRICITYALDRKSRKVVSFSVGRRNKRTLGVVVNALLLSEAIQIRTDKCATYLGLIPKAIHHVKNRGINYIERKNLTLRTHIKRLNRRTIAYSKNLLVLSAILKIYFWF